MNARLEKLNALLEPFVDHRHTRVAYSDLKKATAQRTCWPGLSRESIRRVIEDSSEILNSVNRNFESPETSFLPFIGLGGAPQFVECIRDGLQLRKIRGDLWFERMTEAEAISRLRGAAGERRKAEIDALERTAAEKRDGST